MRVLDENTVLDRQQLRDVTLDDEELMQEVLAALLDDTSRQVGMLDAAIREHDPKKTMRLAHYCKGACANLGANAVATALQRMEHAAARESFDECASELGTLARELEKLRLEVESADRRSA